MTEALGWMAAVGSMLAFGSFGVPIKSDAANSVDIDPLVFQSYKSLVCFVTSWLVLLAGVPFSYTPWGIVSCLFWVPGGIATVFAIRNAGLAIAMGLGGSLIVLVSFVWGIFIFDEQIHSREGASGAIAMMMAGILGMSYFSSPHQAATVRGEQQLVNVDNHSFVSLPLQDQQDNPLESEATPAAVPYSDDDDTGSRPVEHFEEEEDYHSPQQPPADHHLPPGAHDPLERLVVGGFSMTRRQLGIAGAVFNGVWGGSILAPMKWCHESTSGVGYLISFGIGAALVTTACWGLRFAHNLVHHRGSYAAAYAALPSFHLRVMWRAGGTSGLLWSLGNFCSLVSVKYLGEGVGYSVVQSGMLGT